MARYLPPFEFAADMLFAWALAPARPLRSVFPRVPFLSLFGRIPLLLWFSSFTEAHYTTTSGARDRDGGPGSTLYHELNVLALMRRRAVFMPGIYATSPRIVRLAREYYGMPKEAAAIALQVDGATFAADTRISDRRSHVEARLLGSGSILGRILARVWPRWSWPVWFPSGKQVRGAVLATPRVQVAWVREGHVATDAAWLPAPVRLLPVGLFVPGLRMALPQPKERDDPELWLTEPAER